MVNFDELNSQSKQPLVIEPRQLFQTLPRDKQHEYLRDVQGDVLGEWHRRRDERDLVIKMNTGSGKTLVGTDSAFVKTQRRIWAGSLPLPQ